MNKSGVRQNKNPGSEDEEQKTAGRGQDKFIRE
jgi:hypothetical protein